jgi:peroxiredoxin
VLGVSVDFNGANKAFAEKLGLTYPLLSDARRQMGKAYGAVWDDPAMANDPAKMPRYLRAKRAWFIIDKEGVVRFMKETEPNITNINDELLQVLSNLT